MATPTHRRRDMAACLWALRLAVLVLLLPWAAAEALQPGGRGVVTSVTDGDTLTIRVTETAEADARLVQEGGTAEVRLVGIQAPKLPLGRPHFRAWPLAEQAKDAGRPHTRRYVADRGRRHATVCSRTKGAATCRSGH